MVMRFCILVLAWALLYGTSAQAQWISFEDETSQRLRLRPLLDDATPEDDSQEKDLALGDLNRDGLQDIVVVRKFPFSNPGARQDILLMNNNGTLVDATRLFAPEFLTAPTDARDVAIADFTGDDWPDVVIANTFGQQPKFYRNRGNDAGGSWLGLVDESDSRFPTLRIPQDLNALQFCALWAGDVTGDGSLDIYFANYVQDDGGSNPGTNDILMINNGDGIFTNETTDRLGILATVAFGTSVEIHDMDNDGDNDIVKISANYAAPPFPIGEFILFNDGTGNFTNVQSMGIEATYMFTVADLNNDGNLDHYVVTDFQDEVAGAQGLNQDGTIAYGKYTLPSSPRTVQFGGNTKAADLDGDGNMDIGVAPIDVDVANCDFNGGFTLLRNFGEGRLADPWANSPTQNFHLSAHDFQFVDLNGDGRLDIVMGLCDGWRVLIQNP